MQSRIVSLRRLTVIYLILTVAGASIMSIRAADRSSLVYSLPKPMKDALLQQTGGSSVSRILQAIYKDERDSVNVQFLALDVEIDNPPSVALEGIMHVRVIFLFRDADPEPGIYSFDYPIGEILNHNAAWILRHLGATRRATGSRLNK
jgi:hypothetical protein